MKAGVSTAPCGVVRRPRRAAPAGPEDGPDGPGAPGGPDGPGAPEGPEVGVALLLGEGELDREVVEQAVHAARGSEELEDLVGVTADLQDLCALEVAVPGSHLGAANHHRDRCRGLVLPTHAVRSGIGEGAGRLLGSHQHGALAMLHEAGLDGLGLFLLELDALEEGLQALGARQARGHGVGRLAVAGRGRGEREEGEREEEDCQSAWAFHRCYLVIPDLPSYHATSPGSAGRYPPPEAATRLQELRFA